TLRAGQPTEWSWMADSSLRDLIDPSRYEFSYPGEHLEGLVRSLRQRRYLGIFRSSSRALPRVTGEGVATALRVRRLEKGRSLDPGYFHGWLVVMDMETATAACAAP